MLTQDQKRTAEKDIERLEGEKRDADRALAKAQAPFVNGDIAITAPEDAPEGIALDEAGRKAGEIADMLNTARRRLGSLDGDYLKHELDKVERKDDANLPAIRSFEQGLGSILESDGFKSAANMYVQRSPESGPLGPRAHGEIAERDNVKALITRGQGGIDSLVTPERRGLVDASPYEELTILDLLTIGSTDANAIEYPAFLGRSSSPTTPIADPTGTSTTTGVTTKPDIALTFELRSTRVRTLAAGIPVFRNTLEDNGAYLRTVIQEQLRLALRVLLQTEILSGDGTGEHFTGVLNTSGIVTVTKGGTGFTTENGADAIHRALTQLRLTGDQATAVVMHPSDYEKLRLMKDDNGNYLYGPPALAGAMTIWGKPIVTTIAVTAGTIVVADWRTVQLLIRKGIQLLTSDSHSDYFMKNLIQFLAELRAALIVARPAAVSKVVSWVA